MSAASRVPVSPTVDDVTAEAFVSRWFVDYVDAGRAKVLLPVRQPRRTVQMLRHLHRLPQVSLTPSGSPDGATLRSDLRQPWFYRRVLGNSVSALPVPADAADYTAGRPKHALRQKVRAAAEAGVRYRVIDDPAERAALIAHADAHERTAASHRTRNSAASNAHLVPLNHWLLAEGVDGEPLLLAIAAVDGETALLRYYRTLTGGDAASAARYGAMPQLVSTLSAAGVRVLLEAGRPCWTDNAIRQFQRKLGFRVVRIALDRRPAAPAPAAAVRKGTRLPASTPAGRPDPVQREDADAEYARG